MRYSSKPRLGPSVSEGGLGAPPTVDPTQVIHSLNTNGIFLSMIVSYKEGVNMLADAGGIGYGEYLQVKYI